MLTQREYWDEVQSLADGLLEAVRDGDHADRDEAVEGVWETIDGHQWVIYTAYNYGVLQHSDNDGYTLDNFGSDGVVVDGVLNTAMLAFGALYGDVMERIDFDAIEEAIEAREAVTA